ncbi:hypothetical protein [Mycolicibacterium chlorophenolicum]|nr:hypothetical protein [Mycolicibacterium chlorophenolicum]
MRFESALLEALSAEGSPAALACLRWLVTGESPQRLAVDVVWPARLPAG